MREFSNQWGYDEKAIPPDNAQGNTPDFEATDEDLFLAAMQGIERLRHDPRGRRERHPSRLHRLSIPAEDEEALAALNALVQGRAPMTLYETGEYIEGVAQGLDPRLVRRLRQGDFAIQAHLDLHGYTVRGAREALRQFLHRAVAAGQRCVLIIHGRGQHSSSDEPVLKKQVQTWLSQGSLSRRILAFTSARPCDGGAGALYVLLRRTPRRRKRLKP